MGATGNKVLHDHVSQKLDTTMIFPLSEFEQFFGEIWGHGKPWKDLSPEQKRARERWKECRTNILNNGNAQKRQLLQLLERMDCTLKGYRSSFRFEERG